MIEQNAARQMQSVLLAIGADDLMGVGLRYAIGRAGVGLGLLVLQMPRAVTVDFRGRGLKQPSPGHLAADEFADALRDQRIQPRGLDRNVPGLCRARYRR